MSSTCHNCGGDRLVKLYDAPAFDTDTQVQPPLYLARCSDCELVNCGGTNPQMVAASYSRDYYGSGSRKFSGLVEALVRYSNARRAKRLFRRLPHHDEGERTMAPSVLDIGCGRGDLLLAFRALGATVLGLERGEFPLAESERDFIHVGSLADPALENARFDMVIIWHVLEHLTEQDALLEAIAAHLNPGGVLVVAVPNFGSIQQALFRQHWFHLDLPRHLVHIERDWLQQRLQNRGLRIEAESHWDLLQNAYGFVQSALNAAAPTQRNQLYSRLKHQANSRRHSLPALLAQVLGAALLAPVALLESVAGALARRGATVTLVARKERDA